MLLLSISQKESNESYNPYSIGDQNKNFIIFVNGGKMAMQSRCHWRVNYETRKKMLFDLN